MAVEDNILRRTRGSMFRQFSLWFVSIGWDCGPVLTSLFCGGTNAFKQRERSRRIALGSTDV